MTQNDESNSDLPEQDGEAGGEQTGAPERGSADGGTNRSAALPLVALLVAVTIVAVAVGLWLLNWPPATAEEQRTSDRQDALIAAENFGKTVTSFNATQQSQYTDALTKLLADGQDSPCWSTVAALVPAVADEGTAKAAKERKQAYEGSVEDRAIEAIDSDSARALVVVDYSMKATIKGQRVPLAAQRLRMKFDMSNEEGDWLVNECTVVAPAAGDDE